jgi:hypothetical protein
MATITIGSVTLDDTYAPYASQSYEYFTTPNGEIIGGSQVITINGVVSVPGGAGSGNTVMAKLAGIRDLGKTSGCVTVSVPGLFTGQAKITNVTIDQGPDPTWVNQGAYSIELKAQLTTIPSNSMGITASDNVTEISKTESIEIGEDSHGYVFLSDNSLSKAFVKFSCQVSVTCRPFCDGTSPQTSILNLLRRFAVSYPTHSLLSRYSSWIPYAQSRTLEISSNNGSFSADVILLHPTASGGAFVDLEFEHNHGYQDKQVSKRISGTITGLASIGWSDLIDLPDTFSSSKFAQAEGVFSKIASSYNSLSKFDTHGPLLFLTEQPNCPPAGGSGGGASVGVCKSNSTTETDFAVANSVVPSSSSVSKSRTEGSINFIFEWNNSSTGGGDCVDIDGWKKELVVDITEPQSQIVEHIIPSYGTLIQDLNACSAKRVSITSSASSNSSCQGIGYIPGAAPSGVLEALNQAMTDYLTGGTWLQINHTKQTTSKSFTITKEFIKQC